MTYNNFDILNNNLPNLIIVGSLVISMSIFSYFYRNGYIYNYTDDKESTHLTSTQSENSSTITSLDTIKDSNINEESFYNTASQHSDVTIDTINYEDKNVQTMNEYIKGNEITNVEEIDKLLETIKDLTNKNDQLTNSLLIKKETVDEAISPINNTVDIGVSPINNTLDIGLSPINNSLDVGLSPINNSVEIGVSPIINTVDVKLSPINNTVEIALSPIINTLDKGVSPIINTLDKGVSPIINTLNKGVSPIINTLDVGLSPINNVLDKGVSPIINTVDVGLSPLKNSLEMGVSPIREVINLNQQEFLIKVNELLASNNSSYTQMSEETLEAFRILMQDHFNEIGTWVKDINNRLEGTGFSHMNSELPITVTNSPIATTIDNISPVLENISPILEKMTESDLLVQGIICFG